MKSLWSKLLGTHKNSTAKSKKNAPQASTHESANVGRRQSAWRPFDASPRQEHLSLAILRARSRDACRNNPIARAAIERMTTDTIGLGVSPKELAKDEETRIQLLNLWEAWSCESDMDGQTNFYGLQMAAFRAMLESGEVLAVMTTDEAAGIPLKIRLLESDHLSFKNEELKNGNKIIDGIELNKKGQRVAYWLHPSHPGDKSIIDNEPKRIEAKRVLHLFDSSRPGQLRGIPWLSPVLVRLKDLDEFDDAQLIRQKIANLYVGFITRPPSDPTLPEIGPDGNEIADDNEPLPPLEFEPGLLQELAEGENITFSEPPGATNGYKEFTSSQLHIIASALGLPYPFLTGDYSGINDRTARVAINEYRRRTLTLIHNVLIPKFCGPIRQAWVDAAVLAGVLPINRPDLKLVRWTSHAWPYIHPVQEIEADILAINNKLMSRSEALLKRGYDAELLDREMADDLEREKKLNLPPNPAFSKKERTAPQETDE